MKLEKHTSTFIKGIDRDTSVNKYSSDTYYDAQNMRIITEDELSAGALNNFKGNVLKIQFADGDVVIGQCSIRNNYNNTDKNSMVFFVYNTIDAMSIIYLLEGDPDQIDTSSDPINMDQYLQVVGDYKCGYIYKSTDLNFSVDNPIKSESIYESSNIRKIYWTDGINPIRYMIVDNVTLDMDVTLFDINPSATLVQPSAIVTTGGAYTSGVVQYSYQLYIKNGARTTFSPCSNVVYLTSTFNNASSKDIGGTKLGENTGCAVSITIPSLDDNYNRVRLVAIHYTELNVSPVISIVGEFEYGGNTSYTFVDNGYTTYGTIELNEFRILGQTYYYANSLSSKNSIMFYANMKERVWNPSWLDPISNDFFDCRAIRFRNYTSTSSGSENKTSPITIDYTTETSSLVTYVSQSSFRVEINNIKSKLGLSSSDTLNSISAVTSSYFSIDYVIYVPVPHVDPVPTEYVFTTPSGAYITISEVVYSGMSNSLTYKVTYSNIFNHGVYYPELFSFIQNISVTYNYSFSSGISYINAEVSDSNEGDVVVQVPDSDSLSDWDTAGWSNYTYSHDGINNFNDLDNYGDESKYYKYQSDGVTLGAEGPNISISFDTEEMLIDNSNDNHYCYVNDVTNNNTQINNYKKSSQRNEVYRIYIVFYNNKLQYSNPQWICDLMMPSLSEYPLLYDPNPLSAIVPEIYSNYLFPVITMKNIPDDSDITGWQIFRCKRGDVDKSVKAVGLISTVYNDSNDSNKAKPYSSATSTNAAYIGIPTNGTVSQYKNIIEFLSPEVNFNKSISFLSNDKIRIDRRLKYTEIGTQAIGEDIIRYALKIRSDNDLSPGDQDSLADVSEIKIIPVQNSSTVTEATINGIQIRPYKPDSLATVHYDCGTRLYVGLESDLYINTSDYASYFMASYVRNSFNTQYNGNTYEARTYNSVVAYSSFNNISTTTNTCYYGDTFITFFTYLRAMHPTWTNSDPRQEIVYIPVESSIDCNYRTDLINKYIDTPFNSDDGHSVWALEETFEKGVSFWPESYPDSLGNLYSYNKVYSTDNIALTIQCQPFDSINIEDYPTKIFATDPKVNNEYFDSWTYIKPDTYMELENKFGDINAVFHFGNRLFAMQDKSVAIVSVNDKSMIQDSTGVGLTLGTGGVLSRFDYLTNSSGVQSYRDYVTSNKAVYYLDRSDKIIYNVTTEGDNPISETTGIRSLLKSYGTISYVVTAFDPQFKEILFYISDGVNKNVIVYNEYTNTFSSRYSFEPSLMYTNNDHLYSIPSTGDTVYRHNLGNYGEFYGTVYDSYVDMIINPNTTIIDKYDILDLRVDVINDDDEYQTEETVSEVTVSNSYQTPIVKTISFDSSQQSDGFSDTIKGIIRRWRLWLLPDDNSGVFYRMVDTFLRVKIKRSNSNNYKFILHDVSTYYRPIKN